MDTSTENWGVCFGLFVPPVILVSRVLKQMQEQKAHGILVIPHRHSAAFWPLICLEAGGFVKNIIDWIDMPILKKKKKKLYVLQKWCRNFPNARSKVSHVGFEC